MKTFILAAIVLTGGSLLFAQEFSPMEQRLNQKRWDWHQPLAEVFLKGGDTLRGQPVYFDMETLYVFPSRDLPLEIDDRLVELALEEIEGIYMDRGGRITLAQTSGILLGIGVGTIVGVSLGGPIVALLAGNALGVGFGLAGAGMHKTLTRDLLMLTPEHPDYQGELFKIKRWSVFQDSLVFTDKVRELPGHSMAIRRAFPRKHFRVSASLNAGFGLQSNHFTDAIASGSLPFPDYASYASMGYSFVDMSWRFRNQLILGGEWTLSPNNLAYASYYNYEGSGIYQDYTYSLGMQEFRFYGEWVFMPVDRFFTRRHEIVAGAGFMLSLPKLDFYAYRELSLDPYESEQTTIGETNIPFGLQLRASYHYYLFRNFSLSAGLELNMYQNLKVPAVYFPSDEAAGRLPLVDAHKLNYSSIRFKIGAHLYF